MYRAIVVDDEKQIREGIFYGVDWTKFGFVAVCQAADGEEALRLIEIHKPHVVLTDIRMEKMDGLTLVKTIKQNHPEIEILLVSGYSDLEYYQKALEYKVFGYILKPTTIEDFEVKLTELKKMLDERAQKENQIATSSKMKKITSLKKLLSDGIPSSEDTQNVKSLIEESQITGSLLLCVICFFDPALNDKSMIVRNEIIKDQNYVLTQINNNEFVLIMGDEFYNYIQKLNVADDARWAIGISSFFDNINFTKTYYRQALTSVNQMIFNADEKVIFYEVVVNRQSNINLRDFDHTKILAGLFGENDTWQEEIAEVINQFQNITLLDYEYLDHSCNNLYYKALNRATQLGMSGYEQESFYEMISERKSLEDKIQFLRNALSVMRYMLLDSAKENQSVLVNKVNNIIDEKFNDSNFSLTYLGDELSRNGAYLSSVYKFATGMNITDRLMEVRLEHAKKMLATTNERTYIIAEQTGYNGCSYFIKAFKKSVGLTPGQYRTQFTTKKSGD